MAISKENEIGAIWQRTTKNGDAFFSGKLKLDGKEYEIVIFKNGYKTDPRHPDARVYISNSNQTPVRKGPAPVQPKPMTESDVPF